MHALGVLRAYFGTAPAKDTAALYDFCLMVYDLDRLDGAFAQTFVAVLAARVFEIEIPVHTFSPIF